MGRLVMIVDDHAIIRRMLRAVLPTTLESPLKLKLDATVIELRDKQPLSLELKTFNDLRNIECANLEDQNSLGEFAAFVMFSAIAFSQQKTETHCTKNGDIMDCTSTTIDTAAQQKADQEFADNVIGKPIMVWRINHGVKKYCKAHPGEPFHWTIVLRKNSIRPLKPVISSGPNPQNLR